MANSTSDVGLRVLTVGEDAASLIAPVGDGIHGIRLANAIHLSGWTGREVSIADFDEAAYLAELNSRITAEGTFPVREEN